MREVPPTLVFSEATADDAAAMAALANTVAADLTARYGQGHWSGTASERGALALQRSGRVLLARRQGQHVGQLALVTKKPWAIDTRYFTRGQRALYLLSMAVDPALQRQGIGREMIAEAARRGRAWPADSLRLDAYDAAAGAGGFYARSGFREVGRVSYRGTPLIYFEMLL